MTPERELALALDLSVHSRVVNERNAPDMTLYDHVGGDDAIAAAVDGFYERLLADPVTAPWFAGVDLSQLKAHERAFLAVGLGGPELYTGRSMRNAHAGLGITDQVFTITLAHLADALRALGVEADVLRQVIKRIEMMRAAIVEVR